jgi:hypothetical protein
MLKSIDRNNFPPNLGGVKMWQAERTKWQAARLTAIMKEAGTRLDKDSRRFDWQLSWRADGLLIGSSASNKASRVVWFGVRSKVRVRELSCIFNES